VGPLDVVINNAGIMPIGPFVDETEATAKRMVDINLHGVIHGSKLALERFMPRGRGHLVNIASVAGKGGFPGGATYCATKHAVVGLSEAIRAEMRATDIDVSIVMPVVVNTELGSGLQRSRGIKVVEPDDVANAIVEALQTGRVDVYVPKQVGVLMKAAQVLPRSVADFVTKVLKGDQVLVNPDHLLRQAYENRTGDKPALTQAPPAVPVAAGAPAAQAAAAEPEKETV
jgi:short-subunit dehydrogenase